MPTGKNIANRTLADAQDAARKIFREAANAWPAARRFHAGKSRHFAVIERLDPRYYADLAAWLFLLDPKACPDRWTAFGPNAWHQLLSYSYRRLSHSSDESLARLMDAFRTRDFRGPSSSDLIAILRSLIERNGDHPLSGHVMADVEALIDPNSPWPIYSRVARIRRREGQRRREMKRLYRELLKAVDQKRPRKRPRPKQASRAPRSA